MVIFDFSVPLDDSLTKTLTQALMQFYTITSCNLRQEQNP